MNPRVKGEHIIDLIRDLRQETAENEWLEFKINLSNPQKIGETVSALSNGAALLERSDAYLIWGIDDESHEVVGTKFSPHTMKKGNEPLETWLARMLEPRIEFRFRGVTIGEAQVVVLEIEGAVQRPVAFAGTEYIRVGSSNKKLGSYLQKERTLWQLFGRAKFETGIAAEQLSDITVMDNLDSSSYFSLLQLPQPESRDAELQYLERDRLIVRGLAGKWHVTNLGAILFARDLRRFPRLQHKAVRVIHYEGKGRLRTIREREMTRGYATEFKELVEYITTLLPVNEVIESALRRSVPMYPTIAIRELLANMMVHQDFYATGTSPMVEIFSNRVEFTNSGNPLVDTVRFVDFPPKSRNELLTSHMRRFGICEERGSGIDKVIAVIEAFHLPGPGFETPGDSTKVVLYAHKKLNDMTRRERQWACYLHACLGYVTDEPVNNSSIRKRFGIARQNSSQASRMLKDAVEADLLVVRDAEAGTKNRTYLPFWVRQSSDRRIVD